MQNIEIKTPLPDRAEVELRLQALGAELHWTRRQRDTFFETRGDWLKLREQDGSASELIAYARSTADSGPRASDYDRLPIEEAESWKHLLGRVLPIGRVVAKERTLWIWRHTRIHLDRVEGLGDWLELETVASGITLEEAQTEAQSLIETLALDRDSFEARPYRDLLAET